MQFHDYLSIAQIILSVALIAAIILQSKEAGLGGLTGADTGGVFRARRGKLLLVTCNRIRWPALNRLLVSHNGILISYGWFGVRSVVF